MKKIIIILIVLGLISCEKEELFQNIKNEKSSRINSSSLRKASHQLNLNNIDPNKVDWIFNYVDIFDGANNSPYNSYGINDNLNYRQLYNPDFSGTPWIKKAGWPTYKVNQPWYHQVNHPNYNNGNTDGVLSFHIAPSALMLNKRIWPGNAKRYRISFDVDPVVNNTSHGDWVSFMLDNSYEKNGYVTDMNLGFLISSNGNIQLFKNGQLITSRPTIISDEYNVVLDISPEKTIIIINNSFRIELDEGFNIESAHPYIGSYITANSGNVSTLDNLIINTVNNMSQHINYYGYYWINGTYGNYFENVKHYTNFNFVENIDLINGMTTNGKQLTIQVRWEFWSGDKNIDGTNKLNENWETLWQNTLNKITANNGSNASKISFLYIIDEPFYDGGGNIRLNDYQNVLAKVKTDLHNNNLNIGIATNLSYYPIDEENNWVSEIQPILGANGIGSVDITSVNKYPIGNNFTDDLKNPYLDPLHERVSWYGKKMFLTPEACLNCITPGAPAQSTDGQVALNNWNYYNYALEKNNVIGLKNFGLLSHENPLDNRINVTLQVQRLIGNAIINY